MRGREVVTYLATGCSENIARSSSKYVDHISPLGACEIQHTSLNVK